jgi:hypothetical protein
MKSMLFKLGLLILNSMLFISHPFAHIPLHSHGQETFPPPPEDRSRIYLADEQGAVKSLPFETGTTPLKTGVLAKSDKTSYIELKGAESASKIKETIPRFYLFVKDEANVHPPFIVRLETKGAARRVTAMSQKGLYGFAIDSAEIIKPRYRVLARVDGMLYMEVRPREPLEVGARYAIIGTDLERIVSFEVTGLI